MANIYCEICKRFHNPKKTHTQLERDINSKDPDRMLEVIGLIFDRMRKRNDINKLQ